MGRYIVSFFSVRAFIVGLSPKPAQPAWEIRLRMVQPDQTETSATPPAEEDFSPLAELGLAPARRGVVRRLLRVAGIAALVVYFGFAAVVLALRFWILPQIENHPEGIGQIISRNIGQRVSIGSVDSGWQRLRPYLALTDVRLYDQEGRVALSLPAVSCTLSWDSLVFGTRSEERRVGK